MNKKILVVDDSSSNVLLIQNFLEDEGYEVITCCEGKSALSMIPHANPDAILLDLMMPEISGLDVIEHLKSDEKTKHIPIIFISASKNKKDAREVLDRGAHAFLTKPIDFDAILKELDKVL